ncbi:MAG: hypothetical protein JSV80_18500, partial [Acidobacteriota bacterium]
MSGSFRCGPARSELIFVTCLLAASAHGTLAGRNEPPILFTYEVAAAQRVADLDRVQLERELRLRMTRLDCGLQLAEKNQRAELTLRFEMTFWREHSEPGGAPVLDRRTGLQRPGKVWH